MARHFPTTRWSVVLDVAQGPTAPRKALHELCEVYWRPLYAFLRRAGHSPADAEDTVQGFLASLLDGPAITGVQRDRGRFRSYLLGALTNFVAKERTRAAAIKRGGDQIRVPWTIDRADAEETLEIPDDRTPEGAYAYAWAMEILGRARTELGARYRSEDRAQLFAALEPFLHGGNAPAYRDVAARLEMTEAATRVAVHRLR
ncbi:MAG: sigma-70 family RNA polymerase sigma factor, partial [Myxococcota bacterium]